MKSILLSLLFLMGLLVVKAQPGTLVAGTKFQVVQESKLANTSNMMGTDMTAQINSTLYYTIEIKLVSDTGIILTKTTTRIKGSMNAMGQDNSYDSNDSASVNNPMVAAQLKGLNKSETFSLFNGKAKAISKEVPKTEQCLPSLMNGSDEVLIEELFVPAVVKTKSVGYKWTSEEKNEDATQYETSAYTLTNASETEIEISSKTSLTTKGTTKMMGMDVKQNLSGTRNSTLTFQKANGLLSVSTQNIMMSGTEELLGNSIPVSLKGVITTKVL